MAKVLVIDDDADMRGVICRLLKVRGHETVNGDGADALNGTPFDLVICDMLATVRDGVETMQEIRELDPTIPIIAISGAFGLDKFSLLNEAMTLGANHVVSKPFTVDHLFAAVDGLLDPRSGLRRLSRDIKGTRGTRPRPRNGLSSSPD